MTSTHLTLPVLLLACTFAAMSQDATSAPAADPPPLQPGQIQSPPPDKRIFGVLPNYRTANETAVYTPISPARKLTIAAKDSFDYPLLGLAAVLAAEQQWANTNPSFGQGWAGYGHRVGRGVCRSSDRQHDDGRFFPDPAA